MAQSQWTLAVHKIPKEAIIEAIRLRTLKAKKPTVKGIKAKLKILTEEDI